MIQRHRRIGAVLIMLMAVGFLSCLGGCSAEEMASEGFAIYLIGEYGSPEEVPDINSVEIGNTPLIGLEDIICYDSGSHEPILTDSAFSRYQGIQGNFAICIDRRPVYSGFFWSWFSSLSLNRIVILEKLSVKDRNTLIIQAGYPSEDFYRETDPRDDERIMDSLRQAGKLIEILSSEEKIPTTFKGWELYSFERNGEWHYTLIFGTNRTKWLDEIVFEDNASDEDGIYHRVGTGEILSLLGRLENDASIFCSSGIGIDPVSDSGVSLVIPPDDIVDTISQYAGEFGLDLRVYRAD